MGVLVHENYDNELANGVAVTKNPYDPFWPGFYVNVQVGECSVTNPDPNATPDELLISAIGEHGEYETQYIRRSTLTQDGAPVMTAAQMAGLTGLLETIQARFKVIYGKPGRSRLRDGRRIQGRRGRRARGQATRAGLYADPRRLLAVAQPFDPAFDRARYDLHRADRAYHPRHHARCAGAGLRAHRPRQRPGAQCGAHAARAQERGRADRHRDRHWHRAADLGRSGHRDRVRHAGHRPADRRRHHPPRLPDHPGRHPAVLGDLRGGQPARGPVLQAVRSADPY